MPLKRFQGFELLYRPFAFVCEWGAVEIEWQVLAGCDFLAVDLNELLEKLIAHIKIRAVQNNNRLDIRWNRSAPHIGNALCFH